MTETTLQELVGGPKQFRVPLFQRTYMTSRATAECRLTADDLPALLGWFDPDDDLSDES